MQETEILDVYKIFPDIVKTEIKLTGMKKSYKLISNREKVIEKIH